MSDGDPIYGRHPVGSIYTVQTEVKYFTIMTALTVNKMLLK